MAEKTAALYLEANIRADVEAIRARERQLPKITLGDRREEAIRASGRRQSSQPQPRAYSSLILRGEVTPYEQI